MIPRDLAPFFEHGAPGDVILVRNPNTPFERLGRTSVYRAPVGALASLRAAFLSDPPGMRARHRFDQRIVTRHAPRACRSGRGGGSCATATTAAGRSRSTTRSHRGRQQARAS